MDFMTDVKKFKRGVEMPYSCCVDVVKCKYRVCSLYFLQGFHCIDFSLMKMICWLFCYVNEEGSQILRLGGRMIGESLCSMIS
jgi:hypothetical protein